MHANEMTDVRVKGFKALVPGYASNILRNKSALVIGICTTFTYFQTLRLRKRGFLHETGFSLRHRYHFDGGGFLQNRKSLDFDYEANAVIYIRSFSNEPGSGNWLVRTRPKLVCCEACWLCSNNLCIRFGTGKFRRLNQSRYKGEIPG